MYFMRRLGMKCLRRLPLRGHAHHQQQTTTCLSGDRWRLQSTRKRSKRRSNIPIFKMRCHDCTNALHLVKLLLENDFLSITPDYTTVFYFDVWSSTRKYPQTTRQSPVVNQKMRNTSWFPSHRTVAMIGSCCVVMSTELPLYLQVLWFYQQGGTVLHLHCSLQLQKIPPFHS